MKNKTKKSLVAVFLFLFFWAINIFNIKFFNKYGYMPITENFRYVLFPVNFIVSIVAKIAYGGFPLLLKTTMIRGGVGINIIGIIGFLLTLSYYYFLAHFLFLFTVFLRKKFKELFGRGRISH